MKNSAFLLLALTFSLYTCGSPSVKNVPTGNGYELKIVDSVQVDLLSSGLFVADVHDQTGDILVIQPNPPVAYVLSPKGEVLKTMDRPEQDPQAVGAYLLSGEFYEDGIALMGRMNVKIYDADFNLRKSTKPHYNQPGIVYLSFNHLMEVEGQDHNRLLAFFGPQTEYGSEMAEYYKEYNVADILDPYLVEGESAVREKASSKVYKPIGKLTDDSRYLTSGKAFYFMKPMFDVKNNFLYYAFDDDTLLYKLSLPDGKLIEETRIPFDEFILFEGYSMGQAGFKEQQEPRDRAGNIDNVFSVGDFQVIIYKSGMKRARVEELDPKSPDFRSRVDKIDYRKHLILQNGKRVNVSLRLPEKISYFNMSDSDGFIWANQDISGFEEEPELITFYKLGVVKAE